MNLLLALLFLVSPACDVQQGAHWRYQLRQPWPEWGEQKAIYGFLDVDTANLGSIYDATVYVRVPEGHYILVGVDEMGTVLDPTLPNGNAYMQWSDPAPEGLSEIHVSFVARACTARAVIVDLMRGDKRQKVKPLQWGVTTIRLFEAGR